MTTSGAQAQPLGGIQPRAQARGRAGRWASPVPAAEERKRQTPLGRACKIQRLRHEGFESRAGIPPGQSEHRDSPPLPAPPPWLPHSYDKHRTSCHRGGTLSHSCGVVPPDHRLSFSAEGSVHAPLPQSSSLNPLEMAGRCSRRHNPLRVRSLGSEANGHVALCIPDTWAHVCRACEA